MAGVNDILRNSDGTFRIVNGDYVFGDATPVFIKNILVASPGHYKESPIIGASVVRYVEGGSNKQIVSREIKVALKADIFKKPIIDLSEFPSTIKVDNIEIELVQDV